MTEQEKGKVKLELTEAQRATLKKTGTWMLECELDKSDYSLIDVSKICDISPAWLRNLLKDGKIDAFKNDRGHWRVKRAVVAQTWYDHVAKRIEQAEGKKDGKKYVYRRPSEWATHLVEKFLRESKEISPAHKKIVRTVMKQAKAKWDADYQARLKKKAENAAKKEESEQKDK